jgi:hypothetical protein
MRRTAGLVKAVLISERLKWADSGSPEARASSDHSVEPLAGTYLISVDN